MAPRVGVRSFDAGSKRVSQDERQHVVGSAPSATSVRVLIVEDNPHIIETYTYVLEKLAANELEGHGPLEVHFAEDGHQAFTMLLETPYHLVMTDLYMPGMDGFELIRKIRADERLKGLPVVAISAGGLDARERAMQLGVDTFLRKPVRFADVMDTVKQLLRIK